MDKRKELDRASRYMSKLLRHDPETLTMDDEGWVSSEDLIEHLGIDSDSLKWIIENNDKKRFVFNEDKSKVRAAQGHSKGIANDKDYVQLTATQDDFEIYHGTDLDTAILIKSTSILPGTRQYVHWTRDRRLAEKRARQRSLKNPVLVVLSVKTYLENGGELMISENDVYLTPSIAGEVLEFRTI